MDRYETGRFTHADAAGVATRDQLAAFVSAMAEDLRSGGEQEWENGTLSRFLEALAAVFQDRRLDDRAPEEASWAAFAGSLKSASGYE